jgi:hypothetical protein
MTTCPVHAIKLPGCPHPNPADTYRQHQHQIRFEENSNGTWGWNCLTCGAEADEFEDRDSAEDNASEYHRHASEGN